MLKTTSLNEKVYARLKEQIYDDSFSTDTPVFEAHIAERLGVSRTPVREAIYLLKNEGLLESVPGGGVRAYPITTADLDDAFEIRIALETAAVKLAARRMNEAHRTCLQEILKRTELALDQGLLGETLKENETFHKYVASITGSRLVVSVLERIYDFVKTKRWQAAVAAQPEVIKRLMLSHKEHEAIAEALFAADEVKASRLMHDHLANNMAYLKMHLPLDQPVASSRG